MGCGSSSAAPTVKFDNGMPTFKGDEVSQCFAHPDGIVYRIVNKKTGQWALYNDSKVFQAAMEITFSPASVIRPLGNTQLQELPTDEKVASVVIQPLGTEMLIEGRPGNFKVECNIIPMETPAQVDGVEAVSAVSGEGAPAAENTAEAVEEAQLAELEAEQAAAVEEEQPAEVEEEQPVPVEEEQAAAVEEEQLAEE